jgi:AraC-like DNA-binding protein
LLCARPRFWSLLIETRGLTLELSEEQRNQESAGNQQPEASVNEAKAEFQNAQKLKYQKSRLPEEVLNRYQRKLESVMSQQKAYLENDMTLVQLAERLAMPTHHLSQLLNERLGMNFFDYVNQLRVERAKKLLRDPAKAKQPILELAFEAGFNSKSTFNSFFKRVSGHSPSAYRKLSVSSSIPQGSQTSSPVGPDDSLDASL